MQEDHFWCFRAGELLWLTQTVQGCGAHSGSTCALAFYQYYQHVKHQNTLTDSGMLINRFAVPERQMHFEHQQELLA